MNLTIKEKSWILYDCDNSAYSMAVTTPLLPIVFGMFDKETIFLFSLHYWVCLLQLL